MSDEPKRRWFQFHLMTAVTLMICAGGLLWANFCEYAFGCSYTINISYVQRGWPYAICLDTFSLYDMTVHREWLMSGILRNAATVLCLLFAIALLLESALKGGIRTHLLSKIVFLLAVTGVTLPNLISTTVEEHVAYGWPSTAIDSDSDPHRYDYDPGVHRLLGVYIGTRNLLFDATVAFSIVTITTILCEWLIRRREARKT